VAFNRRDTEHTLDFGTSASAISLNPEQNKGAVANSDMSKLQQLLIEMEAEKDLALEQASQTDQMKAQSEKCPNPNPNPNPNEGSVRGISADDRTIR